MKRYLNNLINRFFKLLFILTLILLIAYWSIIYPILKARYIKTKDFTHLPSYWIWIWYQKVDSFYSRFIF